ncbi:MAG TPA: hypothetical protein VMI75_24425 [Polyangiaceae bacterium]|nr:hypothetical protein [Polyangiaceae bacterium]
MPADTASVVVCLALACSAIGCSVASGSGGDAGSGGGEQCATVDAGSSCMGRSVTFCSTQAAGGSTCTSAHYEIGSSTIACKSCSSADLEACGEEATMACLEDGGAGGDSAAD